MTVTAYLEPNTRLGRFELESAQTLQEIHRISAFILERYEINHAVLLYMPSPSHSLTLPLLPIEPSLNDALVKAVAKNTHPAVNRDNAFGEPRSLSDFSTSVSDEPAVTELMNAFVAVGMRQVYELPLVPRDNVRFVLEVARVGHQISHVELNELQSLMSVIPGKLPDFLIQPQGHSFMDAEFRVR